MDEFPVLSAVEIEPKMGFYFDMCYINLTKVIRLCGHTVVKVDMASLSVAPTTISFIPLIHHGMGSFYEDRQRGLGRFGID